MTGAIAMPRPVAALKDVAVAGASVVMLGLDEVGDDEWGVLTASGLRLVHVADAAVAVRVLADHEAQVVVADGRPL